MSCCSPTRQALPSLPANVTDVAAQTLYGSRESLVRSEPTLSRGENAPAAKQGQRLVPQRVAVALQSQPWKRIAHAGPHAQNFSHQFFEPRHGQSGPHLPTHAHGVYAGHGSSTSCFMRALATCAPQRQRFRRVSRGLQKRVARRAWAHSPPARPAETSAASWQRRLATLWLQVECCVSSDSGA